MLNSNSQVSIFQTVTRSVIKKIILSSAYPLSYFINIKLPLLGGIGIVLFLLPFLFIGIWGKCIFKNAI